MSRSSIKSLRLAILQIALAIMSVSWVCAAPAEPAKAQTASDPARHPVYSTYKFIKDGRNIYFGTIPLGAEGVIAETMKHDRILRRKMKEMGLELTFYPFHKGADVTFFAKRGDIDLGTAGAGPTITVAAASDVEITGMTKVSSASLVARKGVREVRDLKGLRIGYPEGGNAQLGLLTALSMAGLKDTDVRMMPMDVGEVTQALSDNRIDAFSAFEPTPTGALAAHKDFVQVHRFFLPGYLFQMKSFSKKQTEASRQIHASFARSIRWLKKNDKNLSTAARWALDSFTSLAGKKPEVTVEQLKEVTRNEVVRFPNLPVVSGDDFKSGNFLQKSFELLKVQGKLSPDSSWKNVEMSVGKRLMREILANSKKFQLDSYVPE